MLDMYVITVISRGDKFGYDGEQYYMERDTIKEVKEVLRDLKESGQDMDYVTVFPKMTGFLGSSFLIED